MAMYVTLMAVWYVCSVLVQCSSIELHQQNDDESNTTSNLTNSSCPTWMHRRSPNSSCRCGWTLLNSIVFCSSTHFSKVGAMHGYCMTHAKVDDKTLVIGSCPYNTQRAHALLDTFYYFLPPDPTKVDFAMCGVFKRVGQFCGQCEKLRSPPVYSYFPHCLL